MKTKYFAIGYNTGTRSNEQTAEVGYQVDLLTSCAGRKVHRPTGENCAAYVLESAVQEEMALLRDSFRVMSINLSVLKSSLNEARENNEYLTACLRSKQSGG